MFFNNCCRRPCCRCEKGYDKNQKNYCDIKDKYDYDKCDKRDYDNNNKCDYGKQDKCCCRVRYEHKCCCDKDDDSHFDKYGSNFNNNHFEGKGYYGEYNNLGFFGQNDKNEDYEDQSYRNQENSRNIYGKEDEYKSYNKDDENKSYNSNSFDKKSYTPNWEDDKDCKYDKNSKHDWDNKGCKPVKYICFPWDKY